MDFFVDSFCFFIFPAPSKTQFISLKPKISLSPEVTHVKPGNYPDFFFNIPRVGLKSCFMPLFGARTSDLYFGVWHILPWKMQKCYEMLSL